MESTIFYLGLAVAGYVIAIPLEKYKENLSWVGSVQSVAVLFLVLTMGMMVGSNRDVVLNLNRYGLYALIYTAIIFLFSLLSLTIVRRLMGIDRYGAMKRDGDLKGLDAEEGHASEEGGGLDRFTLLISLFVMLGISIGYITMGRKIGDFLEFKEMLGKAISIELSVLLIFVGLDMGFQRDALSNIKEVGPRIFIIPLSIIIGTFLGAILTSFILPIGTKESLAIGAGFGWYSLAPAIMMNAGYVTEASISFLHNVMREVFSLLLIPLVAKKIGYVETVALPGAAAMDVTLPIVSKSTCGRAVVYSFISGMILSAAVPILVPLFL